MAPQANPRLRAFTLLITLAALLLTLTPCHALTPPQPKTPAMPGMHCDACCPTTLSTPALCCTTQPQPAQAPTAQPTLTLSLTQLPTLFAPTPLLLPTPDPRPTLSPTPPPLLHPILRI